MALEQLSKSGIENGQVLQDYHVTQSIDALTGTVGYALTISGSLTLDGTTGSGYFTDAVEALRIDTSTAGIGDGDYTVPFYTVSGSGFGTLRYSDTGIKYNPITYNLTNVTASQAVSASQAISASYAPLGTPTSYAPDYLQVDDVTYTSSVPYSINSSTPSVLYISQSAPNGQGNPNNLGLQFFSLPSDDGRVITFNVYYEASSMTTDQIFITSSGVNIYGLGGATVSVGGNDTLQNLGIDTPTSFDCQWIDGGGATGMPQGWHIIKKS